MAMVKISTAGVVIQENCSFLAPDRWCYRVVPEVTLVEWLGPTTISCGNACEVPAGVRLAEVPVPRHAWGDVVVCPHDCGRAFLIMDRGAPDTGVAVE
jgi:hypothetical protein